MLRHHRREAAVALAIAVLFAVLARVQPGYFSPANLNDLFLANLPVLIIASGMTLVILAGDIDISVGSSFAVCGVAAGVVAKSGVPMLFVLLVVCVLGAAIGTLNGLLVARLRLPSIVVTLAMMIALRDALRWTTQGAWVNDLPLGFQWIGLSQRSYSFVAAAIAAAVVAGLGWSLRYTSAGRFVYATGSSEGAARLAGVNTASVKIAAFACLGASIGLAAFLNSVRFNQIPSNAGLGLEMTVIAAVMVGGTSITGGRGTLLGTVLGVILLGAIGPALTFLGVSAFWERAIQGAIILVAVGIDAVPRRLQTYAARLGAPA